MITTKSDRGGIGSRGERESSQRSHEGDEHKLRGEEDHVWKLEMKRPVAKMKGQGEMKQRKTESGNDHQDQEKVEVGEERWRDRRGAREEP